MNSLSLVLLRGTGIPFYRQVKNGIRDRIRSGQLPAGTALPSIRDLAAQLLVSVITIKKAYDDLTAEGFLICHQGKGTFVADKPNLTEPTIELEIREEISQLFQRAKLMGMPKATLLACVRSALDDYEEAE